MTPPAAASAAQPAQPLSPRRRPPAPRPRRVSGPVRAPSRAPKVQAPARDGLLFGLLDRLESLSSHRLLERLIRGRMWIGIIAFALIGIVTLQLGLLKLNSSIGRGLERQAELQRENAALSIENSELASGDRVEAQAERLGMSLVSIADLHFLDARAPSVIARAGAALGKPIEPHETTESTVPSSSAAASEETASQSGATTEQSSQETASSAQSPASSEATNGAAQATPAGSEAGGAATANAGTPAAAAETGGGTAAPGG